MLKIDQEKCIGCGLCVSMSMCDKVFAIKDGKAEVISQEAGECNIQNCIDSCPTQAISNT